MIVSTADRTRKRVRSVGSRKKLGGSRPLVAVISQNVCEMTDLPVPVSPSTTNKSGSASMGEHSDILAALAGIVVELIVP